MIRIREIENSVLRERVRSTIARMRGVEIPDWFEMDDADFVDVLNAIRDEDEGVGPDESEVDE
jgi:hypothetical protein